MVSEQLKGQTDLDEQLAMIDKMMAERQKTINIKRGVPVNTPVDPADLTMCEGCQ